MRERERVKSLLNRKGVMWRRREEKRIIIKIGDERKRKSKIFAEQKGGNVEEKKKTDFVYQSSSSSSSTLHPYGASTKRFLVLFFLRCVHILFPFSPCCMLGRFGNVMMVFTALFLPNPLSSSFLPFLIQKFLSYGGTKLLC